MDSMEMEEALLFTDDDLELLVLTMFSGFSNSTYMYSDSNLTKFNLDSFTDAQCQSFFRFDKEHIIQLAREFRLPEKIICPNRCVIDGVDGLCMLLRRLVYPNRLVDLESFFGRPKSTISMCITSTRNFIYETHCNKLHSLNQNWIADRRAIYANAVHNQGGPLTSCIGFIDGTVRPLCRPTRHQKICYNGHKRIHSLKFQSVVTPDGMIANMYGPMEGRRHDCALLRLSGIEAQFDQLQWRDNQGLPFLLYGDPAYPVRNYLISPFKGANLSPEQELFNRKMSSARECVEWQFGKILSLFAYLDFRKNLKVLLQPVAKYYLVGALLTNCHNCLYQSQTSKHFGLEPPTLHEYLT